MIKKIGEAMSKIKKATSRSNKGLKVLIYKIDKVMGKNRENMGEGEKLRREEYEKGRMEEGKKVRRRNV